jgi:hypothetical protein
MCGGGGQHTPFQMPQQQSGGRMSGGGYGRYLPNDQYSPNVSNGAFNSGYLPNNPSHPYNGSPSGFGNSYGTYENGSTWPGHRLNPSDPRYSEFNPFTLNPWAKTPQTTATQRSSTPNQPAQNPAVQAPTTAPQMTSAPPPQVLQSSIDGYQEATPGYGGDSGFGPYGQRMGSLEGTDILNNQALTQAQTAAEYQTAINAWNTSNPNNLYSPTAPSLDGGPQQVDTPQYGWKVNPLFWGSLDDQWEQYSAKSGSFAPDTDMGRAYLDFVNAGGMGTPGTLRQAGVANAPPSPPAPKPSSSSSSGSSNVGYIDEDTWNTHGRGDTTTRLGGIRYWSDLSPQEYRKATAMGSKKKGR